MHWIFSICSSEATFHSSLPFSVLQETDLIIHIPLSSLFWPVGGLGRMGWGEDRMTRVSASTASVFL